MTHMELTKLDILLRKLLNQPGYLTQAERLAASTTLAAVDSLRHFPS